MHPASRTNKQTIASEFNSGSEMLVRLGYTLCLFTAASVMPLLFTGLVLRRADLVLGGMAAMGLAWSGRAGLQRYGPPADPDALMAREHAGTAEDPATEDVAELITLLRQWDAMEQKRGTPEFEPWALQAWRREIRMLLERSPGLQRLFQDSGRPTGRRE
jgi:hypothetical protein